MGSFWCGLPKTGSFSEQKSKFQWKKRREEEEEEEGEGEEEEEEKTEKEEEEEEEENMFLTQKEQNRQLNAYLMTLYRGRSHTFKIRSFASFCGLPAMLEGSLSFHL